MRRLRDCLVPAPTVQQRVKDGGRLVPPAPVVLRPHRLHDVIAQVGHDRGERVEGLDLDLALGLVQQRRGPHVGEQRPASDHDQPVQVGVRPDCVLLHGDRGRGVVIAVESVEDRDALGQCRLDSLDAVVQVEGGRGATDDDDISFPVEQRVHLAAHVLPDRVAVDAVEAEALAGGGVRVPAHHTDAGVYRLVDHWNIGHRVVTADSDRVHLGRHQSLEHVDVELGVGGGPGGEDRGHVSELLGPLLQTELGQCEHRVVQTLRNNGNRVLS